MRFEPEHDPDPLRSKIRVIESFEDIKGEQYEHFKRLKSKVSKSWRLIYRIIQKRM